jgi:acetylornithine aminotransferase
METLPNILHCHPIDRIDIEKAGGVFLYDKCGRAYLDFESGIWCASLGHNHPRISGCIKRQLKRITHQGPRFTSKITDIAAGKLLNHTALKDGKAVFLSSGSEAMELAIRMAVLYTGRSHLLKFNRSYLGAYGIAGETVNHQGWVRIDIDACLDCRKEVCSISCPQLKDIKFDSIAAFIFEPILASGGILIPPRKVIHYLSKKIKDLNGIIIANEVTTGLGRTGRWLGTERFNVTPDIIGFGKTLGNGYPVSAVLIREEIAEYLENNNFYYNQSHQNDPLGCIIADEVISIIEDEDLISICNHTGTFFKKKLENLRRNFPAISEIRGDGLMLGIKFNSNCFRQIDVIETIARKMQEKGHIIGFKPQIQLLRFLPPYIIKKEQINSMCKDLDKTIKNLMSVRSAKTSFAAKSVI